MTIMTYRHWKTYAPNLNCEIVNFIETFTKLFTKFFNATNYIYKISLHSRRPVYSITYFLGMGTNADLKMNFWCHFADLLRL